MIDPARLEQIAAMRPSPRIAYVELAKLHCGTPNSASSGATAVTPSAPIR
ncbi:MAG: hypothetical protein ACSLE6_00880 [Mycobacterium sp.]